MDPTEHNPHTAALRAHTHTHTHTFLNLPSHTHTRYRDKMKNSHTTRGVLFLFLLVVWCGGVTTVRATPTSTFNHGASSSVLPSSTATATAGGCDRTLCYELNARRNSTNSSPSSSSSPHLPPALVTSSWSTLFDPLANLDALRHTLNEALTTLRDLHSLSSCPLSVSPHATLNLTLATEWSLSSLLSSHASMWEHSVLNASSPWVTPQCKANVLNTIHCSQCQEPLLKPPCTCGETLSSCLLVPARLVGDAWKHAISSVRTGLRLISTQIIAASSTTTVCNGVTSTIERLTNNLNSWREPFSSVARATCDLNQHHGNHQGSSSRKLSKDSSGGGGSCGSSSGGIGEGDDAGLLEFRALLVNVTKTLERFWPQVGGHHDGNPNEDSSGGHSSMGGHHSDIQSEEGYSSHEEEEDDDEEEEYDDDEDWGASGDDEGRHHDDDDDSEFSATNIHGGSGGGGGFNKGQPTDDEDLLLPGGGVSSGDGPFSPADPPPLGRDFDFSNPNKNNEPATTTATATVAPPPKSSIVTPTSSKTPSSSASSSRLLVPLSSQVSLLLLLVLISSSPLLLTSHNN